MRKLMLLAGAAALGLSMPVLAKDPGRGGGRGHGQAAHADRGGGHDRAERRRGGDDRAERHRGRGHQRADRPRHRGSRDFRAARGRGHERAERRLSRDERRVEQAIAREQRQIRQARRELRQSRRAFRDDDRRMVRRERFDDQRDWRRWAERRLDRDRRFGDDLVRFRESRRLAIGRDGCPPGLARQNIFCMPPGQLRRARFVGRRLPFANLGYNIPERYRYRFADDDRFFFRYGNDGTVYRFDRGSGLVSAVIPLVSAGLFVGEPLPIGYDVYNVPIAYRPYYMDSADYLYRYDDNAIYRVDAETRLVEGIVELLTGSGGLGGLGIGDSLPLGYDVYNVPFEYRDTYYDNDDYLYRYADGAIYQVDPETRLIEAVISLLA